jgi:3-oxoacyl-[acyl-carrier protein] reductase
VKTAFVGGGGTGIGYAAAEHLARAGHRVVLGGRTAARLTEAAERLHDTTGAEVTTLPCDVADPSYADTVVACGPLDVVVLNAGGPPPGRITDVTDAQWQQAFEVLLLGPLRLARRCLPGMAERGFGRVVFVTSTAVRQPQPDLAASVVLRSGVTAAAKLLAREYAAAGVTVNCVAPGATATARRAEILANRARASGRAVEDLDAEDAASVPAGRPGEPGEVGAAIAFLASAEASYVTGTVLTVDGGRTETI